MKYFIAFIVVATLSGCNRGEISIAESTNFGSADSGSEQTSAAPKSETLKITYSKADPYEAASTPGTDAVPSPHDHSSMEKPVLEKKPEPQEHQHK